MYIYLWYMHIHIYIYAHNVYIYVHTYNIHSFVHLYNLHLLMHFFVPVANSLDKELAILFLSFLPQPVCWVVQDWRSGFLYCHCPVYTTKCQRAHASALFICSDFPSVKERTKTANAATDLLLVDTRKGKKLPVEINCVLLHFDVPSLIHLKQNCKHLLKLPFIT